MIKFLPEKPWAGAVLSQGRQNKVPVATLFVFFIGYCFNRKNRFPDGDEIVMLFVPLAVLTA